MPPHYRTDDVRIEQGDELLAPMQVMRELAATERSEATTFEGRKAVHDILRGADDRLLVVVGPCSIHDYKAALEYAKRLKGERERLKHDLAIRSEERRVGKECRSRWAQYHQKKKHRRVCTQ